MAEWNNKKRAAEGGLENDHKKMKSANIETVDKARIRPRHATLLTLHKENPHVEQDQLASNQEHEKLLELTRRNSKVDHRVSTTQSVDLSAEFDDDMLTKPDTGLISFLEQVETNLLRQANGGRSAIKHSPIPTAVISVPPVEVIGVLGHGDNGHARDTVPHESGSSSGTLKGNGTSDSPRTTHDQYDFADVDLEITRFMEEFPSQDRSGSHEGTGLSSHIQDIQQESSHTIMCNHPKFTRSTSLKHSSTTIEGKGPIPMCELSGKLCSPGCGNPKVVPIFMEIRTPKGLVKRPVINQAIRDHLTSLETQVLWDFDGNEEEMYEEIFEIENN